MKIEILSESISKKEMLPEVVNRIFAICKTDPHFKLKDEMKTVEERIKIIKEKVIRQSNLLIQSSKLTDDVNKRIRLIKEEIESKQIELLEQLGSEF